VTILNFVSSLRAFPELDVLPKLCFAKHPAQRKLLKPSNADTPRLQLTYNKTSSLAEFRQNKKVAC
jgi:hypothetical protein